MEAKGNNNSFDCVNWTCIPDLVSRDASDLVNYAGSGCYYNKTRMDS